MKPFDMLQAPLAGVNLIEAGAGTGKTHAIAGLYVRLVAELGLTPDQILVVTYTKAATEELKSRIRKRLYSIRSDLESGVADELAKALCDRLDAGLIRRRIGAALMDFDRAAIFTIHGFCQRVLQHFAFETGQLFRNELIQDELNLLQEAADDFWRRYVSSAPIELAGYVLDTLKGPEQLVIEFNRCRYPQVRILPEMAKPRLSVIREWRRIARAVRDQWPQARRTVCGLLDTAVLNGKYYGVCTPHPDTGISPRSVCIASLAAAMDRWSGAYPLFHHFERWGCDCLFKATRKGQATPRHPFFDTCQQALAIQARLEEQLGEYLRYLKIRFLRQARERLEQKKQHRQLLHFDDLLLHLYRALQGGPGEALAQAVCAQYRGILVDEFQDTDPMQYTIFTRLFAGRQPLLFMIGDPKQAIYSFRGADVYAYLHAARSVPEPYTLTRNYRSCATLIQAVNTLFGRRAEPFGLSRIAYEPAEAAAEGEKHAAGMVLWHLPMSAETVVTPPLSQQEAVEKISAAVAGEIARLLADNRRHIQPEEIAVLTRSHRQAQMVKKALSRINIPAVLHSAGNVGASDEAGQLYLLLRAILEPTDPVKVRTALATDLMGANATDFLQPAEGRGVGAWERRWVLFQEYHREWLRYGFYRMFDRLLRQEGIAERLLFLEFGERRMTNLLHLAELLHQAEVQQRLGPEGLLKWLYLLRTEGSQSDETQQLRLESDAHAVQITTMHRSKGLQFEVVFCPFTWTGLRDDPRAVLFHDPQAQEQLTLAIGPDLPPPYRLQTLKEALSENLRMLYVALTRARRRCYWVWGRIRNCEVSAPAYLLHAPDLDLTGDWPAAFKAHLNALTDRAMLADMQALQIAAGGAIELDPLPDGTNARLRTAPHPATELSCRTFGGLEHEGWRIASFSSLISGVNTGSPRADEPPDHDHDALSEPEAAGSATGAGLFDFPGGVRAGLFFHDLLEHADFSDPVEAHERLAAEKLGQHGYDAVFGPAVARMIQTLGATVLPGVQGLHLDQVDKGQRINEMEFYFPLKRITAPELSGLFAGPSPEVAPYWEQALGRLGFAPVQGYMKGFIDMVFRYSGRYYLVDWKSNLLGGQPEAYAPRHLKAVMGESFYFLQYHLYAVALDQLLRCRDPRYRYVDHFGGVYYIFLRGVGQGDNGIFYDRPEEALIARLRQALIDY